MSGGGSRSGGWVKARHGARSASRPEHSDRSGGKDHRQRSARTGASSPLTDAEGASSFRSGGVRGVDDADCCGALGCRETDDLVHVSDGARDRVLCRPHARRWLQ